LPDDQKREKASEYGLIYVYRPMERIKTEHQSKVDINFYQN
jgi:hypothetical protein